MGQMSRYRCVHSLALSFRKAVLSFRHWDPRMQAFWLNNMLPVLAGNLVGAVFCCGTHPHLAVLLCLSIRRGTPWGSLLTRRSRVPVSL